MLSSKAGPGDRVPPPGALVAPHQHVGRRVEEEHAHPLRGRPQHLERWADLLVVVAAAHDQRGAVVGAAGVGDQLGELRDQRGRHVVDNEPAEILEMVGRLRAARPGQARDDDEIAHGVSKNGTRRASPVMATAGSTVSAVSKSTAEPSTQDATPVWANRGFLAVCILLMIVIYGFAVPSVASTATSITSPSKRPSS